MQRVVWVSVLYREPKLLKVARSFRGTQYDDAVSVLYREPKLLKATTIDQQYLQQTGFSALP